MEYIELKQQIFIYIFIHLNKKKSDLELKIFFLVHDTIFIKNEKKRRKNFFFPLNK